MARWAVLVASVVAAGLLVSLTDTPIFPERVANAAAPAAPVKQPCPAQRADRAAALVTARFCGGEVLVSSLTTETTLVWARPNGTMRSDVSVGPVRKRDDRGGWLPVDLTLQRRSDGSVASKVHPVGLTLSGPAGAGLHDLAALGVGDEQVRLAWDGVLPEPTLAGTRAIYADVRPGVDLVVEATRGGFEQFFVVKDRSAAGRVASLPLRLRSAGLDVVKDSGGGLLLRKRSTRAEVGRVGQPVMWDAQTDPRSRLHARQAPVSMASSVRSVGDADLTLAPDAAWLADPATVYPVTIDPSFDISVIFDTFVQKGVTTDQSASTELRLGTYDGGTTVARSLMHINSANFAGKPIVDAKLWLYETWSQSCTPSEWELWWTGLASGASRWTSQPTWNSKVASSMDTKGNGASCNDGWVQVGARNLFWPAADGSWGGTAAGIKAANETDSNSWKLFNSMNAASNIPHFEIIWTAHATVGATSTAPASSCVIGSGRPYLSSTTPTFSAQISDPEGAAVKATFEWWVTNGSSPIGSFTTATATSGSTLSATVPSGAFTEGGTYSWRVRGNDGQLDGPWSSWCEFTVDTAAPAAAPGVSSTTYPQRPTGPAGYTRSTEARTYETGTTTLALTGDDTVATIGLPFTVQFYGQAYTSAWLDTNGLLSFTDPGGSHPNDCVPLPDAAAPNGTVSAFCEDLDIDASASMRTATLGTAPNRRFVIEWNNVKRWNTTDRLSVSVTLHESGQIALNYTGIDPASSTERGSNALVGVENQDGTAATQHAYHQAVLADGHAVVFQPTAIPPASGGAGVGGAFTFTPAGVGDVSGYQYDLDINPPSTVVNAASLGGNATVTITPTTDGPHTLYVRSLDGAGNPSPVYAYPFDVGAGGLTSPRPGDVTAAHTTLAATGHPSTTGVTYQWRRADTDTWIDIPLSHVTHTVGGGPVGSWPVLSAGAGSYPKLNWNVEATLAGVDAQSIARDGPLQVRAVFSGVSNGAAAATKFTFDRNLASAAAAQVGPGSVNLITGNYTIGGSDAAASGIGVGRTFNTRRPDGTDPMFGPGWVSSVVVGEAKAPYSKLTVYDSLVQVSLPGGDVLGFTKKTTTGSGATFDPPPGSEDLVLVYVSASNSYMLTDGDGDSVTFTRGSTDPAGQYAPTAATPPGSGNTTTLSWEKVTVDGKDVVRPTRALAPVPAGVSCTTLVRGCRAVSFSYATATTATGTAEAQWGDYLGRVKDVSLTAWDPDLPTPAMRTIVLARYSYDSTGRLRAAWDPRLDWTDTGSTRHLWTSYAYDGDGVLSTITPAGQQPWQLTYTTLPGDPGKGRLAQVTRSALDAGTATHTVIYKVPVSGSGAPQDMSAGQTSRWGQTEPPVSATALYPPDVVPDEDQAAGQIPTSFEWATIAYLDANARQVNTVAPGGHITTTWYDHHGNVVRELTAGNRRRTLDTSGSDNPTQEAALAADLSTLTGYSTDGQQVDYTLGPIHDVRLVDGTLVRGRTLTDHTYDQGAPAGGPYNLITTTVQGVRYRNAAGTQVDADLRKTTTEYNWTLQQPTASIVDPDSLALATRTGYDAAGDVVSTTNPAGGTSTNTPATRLTIYYTTAANGTYPECGGHAEWAKMVCRTGPGGQPASGPELPATVTTYDMYGLPRTTVEKTSAGILRTTTISYDTAGRAYEITVTAAPGLGTAIPKTRNIYDAATGQNTATQSIDTGGVVIASIGRSFDSLGRLNTYTDADGNITTTTYDKLSRPATINDGKATRTNTYDGGTERRGLPTQVVDSQAGTFTGSYDADGNLTSEDRPGGVHATWTYNESGKNVAIRYEESGCAATDCTLYTESTIPSAHDQWRSRTSTLSSQTYSYDRAGRLSTIADNVNGACTTRTYGYSSATNRTSLTTYNPAPDNTCQSTTGTTTTSTYDSADRLTGSAAYDSLGRTTTSSTATYYVNDIVRSLTQGSRVSTYSLDVDQRRIRSWLDDRAGITTEHRNHYSDDGDSPTWSSEDTVGNYSRPLSGLSGYAGTWSTSTGVKTTQLANLRGDLVASLVEGSGGILATHEQQETGIPRSPADVGERRYGWLGAEQRAADTPSGLILMGSRLYNPQSSRFLQVDPIYGGSANAYEYCAGDPVNCTDASGQGLVGMIARWLFYSQSDRCRGSWSTYRYTRLFGKTRLTGIDLNGRCRWSHAASAFIMDVMGPAIGSALGALIGGALCSFAPAIGNMICGAIGGFIGAALGRLGSWWYHTYCPDSGMRTSFTVKLRRSWAGGPWFGYGYPGLWPSCNPAGWHP